MTSRPEQQLRDIGQYVAARAGTGVGYALFLQVGVNVHYVSNADRGDVLKLLEEWCTREDLAMIGKPRLEPSTDVDRRLALQRRCAELVRTIARATRVALFLFDFGDGGNLAYSMSVSKADARKAVGAWLVRQRGIS